LNHRHKDFQSSALPTELPGHQLELIKQALDYSQYLLFLGVSKTTEPYNKAMQAEFDAVIVGRGLVGMAAARAFATEGMRVALIGPTSPNSVVEDSPDLRVYALSPGTVAMLTELKAWGALVASRVAQVSAMRVYSPNSQSLCFESTEVDTEALNYVVEHGNLAQALEKALTFSSATIFNELVVAVAYEPRAARLTLASGLQIRTKLILAADGADSPMRGLANIVAERKDYADRAVVANLRLAYPHEGVAYQWFCDEGVVAFLPMAEPNQMSLVWSGAANLCEQSSEAMSVALTRISHGALGSVQVVGSTKSFPLLWLKASALVAPRLVLLGDAAHSMHPLAGQGLNLGFGDLATLRTLLQTRLSGQDIGDARFLRHYQRSRAEPVEAMLLVTDQLHSLFATPAVSRSQRIYRSAALLGWGALARSNPIARQVRKIITQRALA
jgi:2-polyprenylphenol 6-hydroxylase